MVSGSPLHLDILKTYLDAVRVWLGQPSKIMPLNAGQQKHASHKERDAFIWLHKQKHVFTAKSMACDCWPHASLNLSSFNQWSPSRILNVEDYELRKTDKGANCNTSHNRTI